MMFGDIIKVTPSSKMVGDMALFMVQNDLTEEDIYAKGDSLSFPASVVEFFEGRLGVPYQGFPQKLQQIILKGRKPIESKLFLKDANLSKAAPVLHCPRQILKKYAPALRKWAHRPATKL